jgi:hypothetical protein
MPDETTHNPTPPTVAPETTGGGGEGRLRMPSRDWLVDEALVRLEAKGLKTKLFQLDEVTLKALCMLLTDRTFDGGDAYRWLNKELGADVEKGDPQVVDDNTIHRFVRNFKRMYGQVRSEQAQRIARLDVQNATDGNTRLMNRFSQNRMQELYAQRLAEAENLEDLSPAEIREIRAGVQLQMQAEYDTARLELERQKAEDRAAKLEAEIEKIRGDQARKDGQIEERIKALRATIDDLSKRASRGEQITEAQIRHADADLIELQGVAS